MPWWREGKCVYKGAKGDKSSPAGCSETEAKAKAHMRALYANSEISKEKAVGDIYAIFPLGSQAPLVDMQQQIIADFQRENVDFAPLDPEDFHITAVYTNGADIVPLLEYLSYSWDMAFAVIIDGIGTFETPDGYAIYLRVRQDYVLSDMQRMVFHAMTRGEGGTMVSSFSVPDNWVAHITMGYSSSGFMPTTSLTPFAVICNMIEVSDENHSPILEVQLKGVEEMLVEKSFPVEIIAKGIRLNDEGDLVIPVYGQPFKGPVKGVADLAGDFFHKGTRLPAANEYATFWDHGRDANYLDSELKAIGFDDEEIKALGVDFGFGRGDIAKAVRSGVDENGIIYDIIVNRNFKYKQALKKAAEQGFIAASGEYKYFEYDAAVPGKVDYAAMVGMALTPSPYNIEARVVKSVELENKMDPSVENKTPEGGAAGAPATTPAAEQKPTPSLADVLTQKAQEIENQLNPPKTEAPATVTITAEQFKAMEDLIKAQGEALARVEKSQTSLVTDFSTVLQILPDVIAKSVILHLRGQVNKSELELASENSLFKGVVEQASRNVPSQRQNGSGQLTHSRSAAMAKYPGSN